MSLETITDNLRDGYKQLVPGTFQHVDELMNERRTNTELCKNWLYTADGALYFLDGKKKTPTLAMTRESDNLVLRHIDDAFARLTENGNYRPDVDEAQAAITATDTVVIDLTKLRLSGDSDEWGYLPISTTVYNTLNREEKKLAARVFGRGKDFKANMQMLADAGITETRVYILNPIYVQKKAQQGPIGRAAWLGCDNDNFSLIGNDNLNNGNAARGVRRDSAPQAHTPENAILTPSFEDVMGYSARYVPVVARTQYEDGLRKLFKK